jgi:CheY-like chemotaxis protein
MSCRVDPGPASGTGKQGDRQAAPPSAVRILIAEDEALVALSLSDMLEAEGYDVAIAGDGAQALGMAQQLGNKLDMLLTDLNMPMMTGEALIRALRLERPDLPVVVVTGSPPDGGAEELRQISGGHGPLRLLHKPIDYAGLAAAVRDLTPPRLS